MKILIYYGDWLTIVGFNVLNPEWLNPRNLGTNSTVDTTTLYSHGTLAARYQRSRFNTDILWWIRFRVAKRLTLPCCHFAIVIVFLHEANALPLVIIAGFFVFGSIHIPLQMPHRGYSRYYVVSPYSFIWEFKYCPLFFIFFFPDV